MVRREDRNVVHLLNNLAAIDLDAIEAYQTAIERLKDESDREQLRELMREHEQHAQALNAAVRDLGGTPTAKPDLLHYLTKGKVVLAALVDERAVLATMKTNEDDTNIAYEKALEHRQLPPNVREILERNLGDERRHRAWLVDRLGAYAARQRHA